MLPDGAQTDDICYDINANVKKFDVRSIAFCVPNIGSQEYASGPCIRNFASDCMQIGAIELMPTLANLIVVALQRVKGKRRGHGKRRCWIRLAVQVGMDVTIKVS